MRDQVVQMMMIGIHVFIIAICSIKCGLADHEGFIIKHYSGLCLAVRNNTSRLYLRKSCDERFRWTATNALMHVHTSMCLTPEDGKDNAKLVARSDCSGSFSHFMLTRNLSLRHIKTRKCVHPYWGCPVPSQGEDMVLHNACDEERLRFEFITEDTECKPLYPYCNANSKNLAKSSQCNQREIKGLDWHWVYIISVVGSAMIVGQFIFILCIYLKMAPKIKTLNEGSLIKFKKTSHEEAVPGGTSTNVQMISIKSTESDEFSNSSNSTIDKIEADENQEVAEERSYINIDYNQNKNKGKKKSLKRQESKDRTSKRLSKLSVDVSKMRHLFKIRKSYTLNDLEMLKRISIERHEYEEPISPISLNPPQSMGKKSKAEVKVETSGYIEPDTKHVRGRSASVPAKFFKQEDGYLKPIPCEKGKRKGSSSSGAAYANLKPSSPTRTEKNLYDMPDMALIEEDAEECLQLESHTYVKILDS